MVKEMITIEGVAEVQVLVEVDDILNSSIMKDKADKIIMTGIIETDTMIIEEVLGLF
jgi:hypothetical protein